jgi:hypothetical protein
MKVFLKKKVFVLNIILAICSLMGSCKNPRLDVAAVDNDSIAISNIDNSEQPSNLTQEEAIEMIENLDCPQCAGKATYYPGDRRQIYLSLHAEHIINDPSQPRCGVTDEKLREVAKAIREGNERKSKRIEKNLEIINEGLQ